MARGEAGTAHGSLAALEKALSQGAIATCYLIVGDDRLAIDGAVAALENACVPEDLAALNRLRVRGADHAVDDILATCATLPMLGDRRVVVVLEPERLSGTLDDLAVYTATPCPSTTLVLVPMSLDRRTRAAKSLLATCTVVTLEAPSGRDLEAWTASALEERGLKLEPDARDLLADLVQADTLLLSNELEKLALYREGTGVVRREDVEALLGRTRSIDVWELTNALEDGSASAALVALRRLREQGTAVPLLVGTLDWCLGRLFGGDEPKAPPGRRRAILARRRELAGRGGEILGLLRQVDLVFRTSGGNADAALERLILAACR